MRVDGKREIVCKKAFASLHGVSLSRVRRIAKASSSSIVSPKDMRGKHTNRPHKISAEVKKQVRDHIKSFPAMKSHYSRNKNKRRRFLSPTLSVAEMHRLYLQKYEAGIQNPTTTIPKCLIQNSIFHLVTQSLILVAHVRN